jgi:hypothetical protein
VESYSVLLVLALGIVLFGLGTLVRAWRASRAADSAWYSVENRQITGQSTRWGVQAVVLLITGALLLIWIALRVQEPVVSESLIDFSPTIAPSPSETAPLPTLEEATEEATPAPTSPSPTEENGLTLVPVPTLILGSQAVITNTGGGGLWMRDAPFGNGLILIPEGSTIFVRGGLVEVNGLLWQGVADADGREGWVAADYLLYR